MDILLVRVGALGDLLLLRRSVASLRAGGHRVRLLAPAAGDALVGPGRGEVAARLPWESPETAALLAGTSHDGAVAEALADSDLVIAWTRSEAVRGPLRRLARRSLFQDPAPPVPGPHASRWLAQCLAPLGLDASPEPPLLSFSSAERDEARARLARIGPSFLAIHPGSGSATKNWPLGRFRELAARSAAPVLWVLGPAEIERGLANSAPAGALVAHAWPRRTLAAAFARAALYVGNDSGASHLAAASGAPTLALFGPTDPAQWSPLGPRVRTLRGRGGSLETLGVEAVEEAARRLTSEASGPPSG